MHIHLDISGSISTSVVKLPAKAFSLSISASKVVVAMASRLLHIYDLQSLALLASKTAPSDSQIIDIEPWQQREASLKFMTRTVACMPDDAGYASSSIEGRVAVEWFDSSPESQARKYAFKCHRQPGADGVDLVYPVNALEFHPSFGSFASGGGDGVVALWDGIGKRRIRQYQKYPASISALSFSHDGKNLAIGVCPDVGDDDIEHSESIGLVKVFIRVLTDTEVKGKSAK
ncbi:MAG: hypothetical protein M1814_000641 [Vezdaea aestivalis]|nr:MAG: hypothetical protein M1814_000641 [Vezdaea aestivalis]